MKQKGQVRSDLGKLISYSARLKEITFLKRLG
ncbi:rCG40758 [Rattus norvegicus]|uniref:RCG40758 n=1 Tax=Rattus norvegicus TaxID=10116 RepID=A6KP11_RAT|nr:rCG40758 [Rattus norvegicus]